MTAAVAGCTGSGVDAEGASSPTDASPTETTTTETSAPTATPTPTPYPPTELAVEELDSVDRGVPSTIETSDVPHEPFRILAVGERSQAHIEDRKPHQVWVANDADEARTITFTLLNPRGTVFTRSIRFEANSRLAVVLRVPGQYEFAVDYADRGKKIDVPYSWFDCNASATDVVLRDDGDIDTGTITTELACTSLTPGSGV